MSQVLAAILLVVVGATALPGLTGCGQASDILRHAVVSMSDPAPGLDSGARAEVDRFFIALDARAEGAETRQAKRHFEDAFRRVRGNYVEPINDRALIDVAIEGLSEQQDDISDQEASIAEQLNPEQFVDRALHKMVASLDPHSGYLDAEEYRDINIVTKGEFGGLGIRVTMDEDAKAVRVISPIEDTPADHAGIKAGDLIVAIDGGSIWGFSLQEAVRLMRGAPGTDILLTIQRGDAKTLDINVTRDVIRIKSVRWRREGTIGYVRVSSFNRKVAEGIEQAFSELRSEAGGLLTGVVLDLRNNPGGLLDQSLSLSDAFLNDGVIVSVRSRQEHESRVYKAQYGDLAGGLPMVVLINGGSASASEIVASALKENNRAIVMGERSFGKGSVQTITPLAQLGALRLTTALYFGPGGHTIQAQGVVPDIRLKVAVNDNEADDATSSQDQEKAKETLRRRESDLPDAFPAEKWTDNGARAVVDADKCPTVGEEKDQQLGCAILYLQTGSLAQFTRRLGADMTM